MAGETSAERRRRRPVQERSQATVEFVLEAAAQVFKREGFGATTNRIAAAAGVSIGSLYEYFPNKQALLLALAERHVALAESGIHAACTTPATLRELLAALQQAILASQRFPSQALALVAQQAAGPALQARALTLRQTVLQILTERASHLSDPPLRARAAFDAIGELSARALYELTNQTEQARLCAYLLDMAVSVLQ